MLFYGDFACKSGNSHTGTADKYKLIRTHTCPTTLPLPELLLVPDLCAILLVCVCVQGVVCVCVCPTPSVSMYEPPSTIGGSQPFPPTRPSPPSQTAPPDDPFFAVDAC